MSQRRILFIAPHRPNRSPSQRYRFEQFHDALAASGYDYDYSYLISEEDDKALYSKGNLTKKAQMLARSFKLRQEDVKRADRYDIIFVQREAFMTGTTLFERKFARCKAKLVYYFDDSIWLSNVSDANRSLNFLKDPRKTARIIQVSDHVIAGNAYLADYALKFNPKVSVIPTCIDTKRYQPKVHCETQGKVTIGWTGSITTIQHFKRAEQVLLRIKEKYGPKVSFLVIGDPSFEHEGLAIKGQAWNAETETEDLLLMDIGIMPLPDDEWSKGKCGFKGLQYMGSGIPTIMSPVGVNTEIVQDGVNGLLAFGEDEWFDKLCSLIEDASLRETLGAAGRRTVEEKYSVEVNAPKRLEVFDRVLGE